jgi:hypothetical protein
MLQTGECMDKTRRALESSLAVLDRRVPSLIRTPYATGVQGSVRALPFLALSLAADDDGDLERYPGV